MNGWCCALWSELGKELSEIKTKQLNKLIKKGIPRSTFAQVFSVMNRIGAFCPVCGSKATNPSENVAQKQQETEPPKKISKVPPAVKCPPCRGTGLVGDGLNCMTCLGTGTLTIDNPNRSRYDGSFAEEQQAKMDAVTKKITEKESEIAKNPKPIREDATPEAIKNL